MQQIKMQDKVSTGVKLIMYGNFIPNFATWKVDIVHSLS